MLERKGCGTGRVAGKSRRSVNYKLRMFGVARPSSHYPALIRKESNRISHFYAFVGILRGTCPAEVQLQPSPIRHMGWYLQRPDSPLGRKFGDRLCLARYGMGAETRDSLLISTSKRRSSCRPAGDIGGVRQSCYGQDRHGQCCPEMLWPRVVIVKAYDQESKLS